MRKIKLLAPVFLFFIFTSTYFTSFSLSTSHAVPVENSSSEENPRYLRASVFVTLSLKKFEVLTGKKLTFPERLYFKIAQRKLKHQLRKNPELTIDSFYDPKKEKFKFDPLWFVVTAFVGPLGLLAAYTSKIRKGGPTKKNKITSAWIGFAFFVGWFGYLFVF